MGISDLSDDVLSLILVRLPIECIGQSKCVSKPWNALISSQKFIKSHLIQSRIAQKPNILVSEIDPIFKTFQMEFVETYGHKMQPDLVKMYEFSITVTVTGEESEIFDFDSIPKPLHCLPELLDERFIIQIAGSSNGLVCLLLSIDHHTICSLDTHESCRFVNGYSFVLCNPLTKSTWDLPGNQWKSLFSDHSSLYGFWFDDVNDDYKVVVMNLIRDNEEGIFVFECEVYSLKSNSWSKVTSYLQDSRCDYKFSKYQGDGVLFNCALHWILLNDQYIQCFILVLDLVTYKLNILPFPEVQYRAFKLTVLNDTLVLSNGGSGEEVYDLWTMKKDSDSWMRITIPKSYSGCSLTPLALFEDNHKRILVSFDDFDQLLSFTDLVSYQKLRFRFPCDYGNARQLQFVGSLVQPYPPSVGFEKLIFSEDDFDKFCIHVNGVSIDSQLPEDVRRKYYDLCCSRKSFLHERLVPGIRSVVAVRMITEAVNIVDSVRSCKLSTSKEEIEKLGKSVRSLELLGMDVGFLRDRICLLSLAFDSEEGIEAKKYGEAKSKMAQIEDEIVDLEKKIMERKQAYKKYGDEVGALELKGESYELIIQEQANAPW